MSIPEFTGNETGMHEDPRDNNFYENYYDPPVQYLLWISNERNNIGKSIRSVSHQIPTTIKQMNM